MQKTLLTYSERRQLNSKNAFFDRIIKANQTSYQEAIDMFTKDVREIFMEGAEKYGWFAARDKKLAKKMLLLGDSFEKVAAVTELPLEIVIEIANQLQELPANA